MSTPIYDALVQKYQEAKEIAEAEEMLYQYEAMLGDGTFEIDEKSLDQVPNIIRGAAKNALGKLRANLALDRSVFATAGEYGAYISGILSTVYLLDSLDQPRAL